MALAYKYVWLLKDVVGIKASLCVSCDNEEYEISKSQLQLKKDKWDKINELYLWEMQFELWLMSLRDYLYLGKRD